MGFGTFAPTNQPRTAYPPRQLTNNKRHIPQEWQPSTHVLHHPRPAVACRKQPGPNSATPKVHKRTKRNSTLEREYGGDEDFWECEQLCSDINGETKELTPEKEGVRTEAKDKEGMLMQAEKNFRKKNMMRRRAKSAKNVINAISIGQIYDAFAVETEHNSKQRKVKEILEDSEDVGTGRESSIWNFWRSRKIHTIQD